jgi:hypothetical protein
LTGAIGYRFRAKIKEYKDLNRSEKAIVAFLTLLKPLTLPGALSGIGVPQGTGEIIDYLSFQVDPRFEVDKESITPIYPGEVKS